jgi:hypothetical protein
VQSALVAPPPVEFVPPDPVAPEPVAPEPVAPEPVAPEPFAPEPVAPEPVAPEPVAPEPPGLSVPAAAPDPEGVPIDDVQPVSTVAAQSSLQQFMALTLYGWSVCGRLAEDYRRKSVCSVRAAPRTSCPVTARDLSRSVVVRFFPREGPNLLREAVNPIRVASDGHRTLP